MASLADTAILSDAENRPPMLEKDMYDSWRSKMELYMLNRQHGKMILESVKHGPLLWPSVTDDGETRLKKYFELSSAEAIQADCDVKETIIILKALPSEIYALVSTHKVAKDLWERIQMLMQDTSDVKLVRDLHTTNVDQLHAYLGQHEYHANESSPYTTSYHTPQFVSQGSSSLNLSISYPINDTSSTVNHNAYMASAPQIEYAPQIDYAPIAHHPLEFSSLETRLVVPVFQKEDDPIDAINHMMYFLTSVVTSRPFASGIGGTSRWQRVIVCYNCKGEDHMAKQCTKPRRKRDAEWFKDKVLLVQAQANGQKSEKSLKEQMNDNQASTSYEHSLEIETLKHALSEHLKEKESLNQKITLLKNDFQKEESRNIDRELALEKQAIMVPDTEETLMLAEESRSKMIEKQNDPQMIEKKVRMKPINYAILNQLSTDFETRFVPQNE
nr:hypothetical protein [Tanacetum cinerariifolium]